MKLQEIQDKVKKMIESDVPYVTVCKSRNMGSGQYINILARMAADIYRKRNKLTEENNGNK